MVRHGQDCHGKDQTLEPVLTGFRFIRRVFGETVSTAKYLQRFSGPGLIVASAETVRYAVAACAIIRLPSIPISYSLELPNNSNTFLFSNGSI